MALLLVLLAGTPALAQEPGLNFGVGRVTPEGEDSSWILRLEARPGDRAEETFVVRNFSGEAVAFDVYAADAITGPDGGVGGLPGPGDNRGAALWLRVDRTEMRVSPGRGEALQVRLQVPPGAPPGDHLAYVFLETEGAPDREALAPMQRSGVNLTLKTRLGLLFWIRVPGGEASPPVVSGLTKTYAEDGLALELEVANPGALLQKWAARWTLVGEDGTARAGGELPEMVLLPRGAVRVSMALETDQPIPRGTYTLRLEAADGTRAEFPLPLP